MSPTTCCACSHFIMLPTSVPARSGSSPAYSNVRPFLGSRVRFTPPPKVILNPWALSSPPITSPYEQADSESQLDAAPRFDGIAVAYLPFAPLSLTPYAASEMTMGGIPRRFTPSTYPAPPFERYVSGICQFGT